MKRQIGMNMNKNKPSVHKKQQQQNKQNRRVNQQKLMTSQNTRSLLMLGSELGVGAWSGGVPVCLRCETVIETTGRNHRYLYWSILYACILWKMTRHLGLVQVCRCSICRIDLRCAKGQKFGMLFCSRSHIVLFLLLGQGCQCFSWCRAKTIKIWGQIILNAPFPPSNSSDFGHFISYL